MISAGVLRERATVLKRSVGLDDFGRPQELYLAAIRTVSCQLIDQGATESEASMGTAAVRRFEVRMRWKTLQAAGITERDRLRIGDRVLRIESIVDAAAKRMRADLACVEVVR